MPGYGIPSLNGSFKAYDEDLVNKQFRAAKLTSDGTVDFSVAATDKSIGIINNVPDDVAGRDVEVILLGEAKAKAGAGGWTIGAWLTADANGDLVAMTPASSTVNYAVGYALEAADQYDIKRIFVLPSIVLV